MFLRSLAVLTCLAVLCPAQSGEGQEELIRRKRAAAGEVVESQDGSKEAGKPSPDESWEKMTPEQRLNHNIRHGASTYCTFTATPKPARLMPGQSGIIVVTAILRGDAVLPAPATLEVLSPPQQGLATLGAPSFRPAEAGKLAKGYLGRPVYDNWAIFEVPVTMSTEAVVGKKQPIALEMRFDLYDGNSAQAVGRFIDRTSTEIEIGLALDPAVAAGRRAPAVVPTGESTSPTAAASSDAQAGRKPAEPSRHVEAAPVASTGDSGAASPAVGRTEEFPAVAEEEGVVPMPLLLGGGALVIALLLLLLRRK